MPNPQPDIETLPPGASQGPFSRYLTAPLEGKAIEDTTPMQRPSGFMGTSGKLAMFGTQILKGLQQGQMQAYAQREQDKINDFEQLSRRVKAFSENPDIPNEVKAEAQNLLGQVWSTSTKEQVQAAKKFHGKQGSGVGSHVLGIFEHLADKLGGPTPSEHNLQGGKDPNGKTAMDRLNGLIADSYTGGEKYSLRGRWDAGVNKLNEIAKQYPESKFDELVNAPEFRAQMDKLRELSPQRAQMIERDFAAARPRLDLRTQLERNMMETLKNPAKPAVEGPAPRVEAQAPVSPTSSKPAVETPANPATPAVEAPAFKPYQLSGLLAGTTIDSPEREQQLLSQIPGVAKQSTKVYFKRTKPGTDGKEVERIEAREYPEFGVVISTLNGKRVSPEEGWVPTTPGDKDAVTKTPPLVEWKHYDAKTGKEVVEFVEKKPGMKLESDPRPTRRAGGGKPVDPEVARGRKLMNDEREENHQDKERKRNAGLLANKILQQAADYAREHNMSKADALKLIDQRIEDFPQYYGDDSRFKDNYDAIHEILIKRKGEAVALSQKEVKSKVDESKARKVGAIPKVEPVKSKGKLTDESKAREYLNKAGNDVNKARELAKKDGWEF